MFGDFPFMLSQVEAFLEFSSRIKFLCPTLQPRVMMNFRDESMRVYGVGIQHGLANPHS
jgi:hypothetical protein